MKRGLHWPTSFPHSGGGRLRERIRELTASERISREPARRCEKNVELQGLINFELVKAAAKSATLPAPVQEYEFSKTRRFRLDFAIVDCRIGIELEGGIYTKKVGHTSIGGMLRDMYKGNLAVALGWRVFRLTPDQLKKGALIEWFKKLQDDQ